MKEHDEQAPKIGAGHLGAFMRQGLAELRNALYPEGNIAERQATYGIYGTKTPGEVAADRRSETPSLDEERDSGLNDRLEQAKSRDDHSHGKEDRERGLDRE